MNYGPDVIIRIGQKHIIQNGKWHMVLQTEQTYPVQTKMYKFKTYQDVNKQVYTHYVKPKDPTPEA